MKKRIFSLLLCIILCLSLMPMSVLADGLPVLNASISEDGILSWDVFQGAARYVLGIADRGGFVTGTLEDLNDWCEKGQFGSGDYIVFLYAVDASVNQISKKWTGSYHYDSTVEHLAAPQNLRFEGSTCKWDAVPNATHYIVALLDAGDYRLGSAQYVTDTQYTFTLEAEKTYKFQVKAFASGYLRSKATSDIYTYKPITDANCIIKVPVAGAHPDQSPVSSDSTRYTVSVIEWYWNRKPYPILKATDTFEARKQYVLLVKFTAKSGYMFDENTRFTINGLETKPSGVTGVRRVYFTVGDTVLPDPDHVLPAFTVSHSCTLNECLELNYYIPVSTLDGFDNVKLTVQYERFNGDTRTVSEEKTLTPTTVTVSGSQRYRFSFKGIAAAEIGSKVYATVTAEKNGVVYCAEEPDVYSIADYCYAVLESSSMSDSLKTLCVDTLNYGAAAQTHFNVNPGKLCNADLTNAQKARSVGNVTLTACNSTAAYAGTVKAGFGGKSYVLNNAPELKLRIVPNSGVDASRLKVKYTYTRADRTEAAGSLTPERDGSDWVVRLNTVAGPDLRSPIRFIICEGSKQVSDTLTFSAEGYSYAMTNSATSSQTLKDLCRAMMNFSEAARRHFG